MMTENAPGVEACAQIVREELSKMLSAMIDDPRLRDIKDVDKILAVHLGLMYVFSASVVALGITMGSTTDLMRQISFMTVEKMIEAQSKEATKIVSMRQRSGGV